MIKNVVFDFGGIIIDIDRDQAVKAFQSIGLKDADTRLDKYHQTGLFQELEEGKIGADEFRIELEKICKRPLSFKEVQKGWLGFVTGISLNKLHYLKTLKQKMKVHILSNTNPYIMEWACSTRFTSEGKPLTEYCDECYFSYQIGYTKPAPEIFKYMLENGKMKPEETLFVDDGSSNIRMGQELGMHTYLAKNGEDWREAISTIIRAENGLI